MIQDRAADLIASVWPHGLSSEDEEVWAAATPQRREQALLRLEALLEYERGDFEATPLAARLGTSAATFFRMLAKWRSNRTLASLVPHGLIERGSKTHERVPDQLRVAARDLIASSPPTIKQEALVRQLQVQFPDLARAYTVRKVVIAEQAMLRRAQAVFGRTILVDSVVVDVELSRGRFMRTMVNLIIDKELGLVLAVTRPDPGTNLDTQWSTLLDVAEAQARSMPQAWQDASGEARFEIVMPDLGASGVLRHLTRLDETPHATFVAGERRTGVRAHKVLAGRIGRLMLRPRLPPSPKFELKYSGIREGEEPVNADPVATPELFDSIMHEDVALHNEKVLAQGVDAFAAPLKLVADLRAAMLPPPKR